MRKVLGRGLEALIPELSQGLPEELGLREIPLGEISPGNHQPRKDFNREKLEELSRSIREKGLLQPIVVRKIPEGYGLVTGERRWRAAREAGLERVPALVIEADERELVEIALVENIQRADLNPMEEATAFHHLVEGLGLTQEEAARRVGKDRSTVANILRLLKLPEAIRESIQKEEITMGHARALLSLPSASAQLALWRKIKEKGLSVRQTEALARKALSGRAGAAKRGSPGRLNPFLREIEERLRQALGTKVRIRGKESRGRVEVEYYSREELEGVLALLGCDSFKRPASAGEEQP
ncbi:MAG: ParB/RepB/Spo0J family partition protein [Nitrospinota bacterium]